MNYMIDSYHHSTPRPRNHKNKTLHCSCLLRPQWVIVDLSITTDEDDDDLTFVPLTHIDEQHRPLYARNIPQFDRGNNDNDRKCMHV